MSEIAEDRVCRNCRWWNAHSTDMKAGDCMVPGDHRYSRVPMHGGGYALLDSFGREETKPNFKCGAHKFGHENIPAHPTSDSTKLSRSAALDELGALDGELL